MRDYDFIVRNMFLRKKITLNHKGKKTINKKKRKHIYKGTENV